jgi:hypothetical protein
MSEGFDPRIPFTHAEALRAKITPRALRGATYRKIFPGVYIDHAIPDTLVVRARAAMRILPGDAVASHATAARLWGGAVPDDPALHFSFTRHNVSSKVDGIKIHRFREPFATWHRHGIRVTTPEQTLIHLTRALGLVELVALADQFVRRDVTSPEALFAAAASWPGQGARLARQAAGLCRSRVDSPAETRVRLLMVLAGLPEPRVNYPILRFDGTEEYRLDLAYPEVKLAIEYDGRWHDDPQQRALDEARRGELVRRGWYFIVLVAADVFEQPDATLARLHQVLRQHGIPVPDRLRDDWRTYHSLNGVIAAPADKQVRLAETG